MSFQVGAFHPAFQQVVLAEVPELVGGGGRERRKKRRLEELSLVPAKTEVLHASKAPQAALAVALRELATPSQTDVAMSSTAEIAMLIRRAQEKEEEAIVMMISEML